MYSNIILKTVKALLITNASNFCIKTVIYLLENVEDVSDISKNNPIFKKEPKQEHLQELITLKVSKDISIKKISDGKYANIYELRAFNLVSRFKSKVEDVEVNMRSPEYYEDLVTESFDVWLQIIGSDTTLFIKTPALTKGKGRRNALLKAFKQGHISSIDEVTAVCNGARKSLYFMGYDKYGTPLQKNHCDIPSLLSCRQRIEDLMNLKGDDYTKQLESLACFQDFKTGTETNRATNKDISDNEFF